MPALSPDADRPRRSRGLPRHAAARLADLPGGLVAAAAARCAMRPARFTPSVGRPTTRSISAATRRRPTPRLTERLACLYAGRPRPSPVDRALARVVAHVRHSAGSAAGVARRLRVGCVGTPVRIRSPTCSTYASRVAGSVGVMMALLMGRREPPDPGARRRSRHRHAAHEHRPGRRRGCPGRPALSAATVAACSRASTRTPGSRVPSSTMRSARWSRAFWRRRTGSIVVPIAALRSFRSAVDLEFMRRERSIRRSEAKWSGADWIRFPVGLSCRRRASWHCSASSLTNAFLPMGRVDASPLAEARHLIDAVTAHAMPRTTRRVDSRIVWLIELFDRLERREQERSGMARRERSASA